MKNYFLRNLPETSCKILEILYLLEERRNTQQTLQLTLSLFSHAVTIKIHLDEHIKSISERDLKHLLSQPNEAFCRVISFAFGMKQ